MLETLRLRSDGSSSAHRKPAVSVPGCMPQYARAGYRTQSGSKHQGGCLIEKKCSHESVCLKCSSRKAKIYKLIYKLKESTAAMSQLKRLDGWSLGDFVSSEEELVLGWFPPARHGCHSGRPKSFLWPPAGAAVSQSLYHHHRSPEQWVTL